MSFIRPPGIFNAVDDILYKNDPECLSDANVYKEYNCFMINRWISMHSSQACMIVNSTTNIYWNSFHEKEKHHTFLRNILPVCKRKRLQYSSGVPKNETPSAKEAKLEEKIKLVAVANGLSIREVTEYVNSGMLTFDA